MRHRDRAALVCIVIVIIFATSGEYSRMLAVIPLANFGPVFLVKNVPIVNHSLDLEFRGSAMKRSETLWGNCRDKFIREDEGLSGRHGCVSFGTGNFVSDRAILSACMDGILRPHIEGRGLPVVFENKLKPRIRSGAEIRKVLGVVSWQVDHEGEYPSPLSDYEGSSAQLDLQIENEQTKQSEDRYGYRNQIEMFSRPKRRGAMVLFFGVLLIVFGGRMNLYGERVWDTYHEVLWWAGYATMVLGLLFCVLVLIEFAFQWVNFPGLILR